MSGPARYRMHGLLVESPWPLPAPIAEGGRADFIVAYGGEREATRPTPPPELTDGDRAGPARVYRDWPRPGNVTFCFEGLAEFELDESAGTISAWSHPGSDPALLPILLDGNVAALVLGLRGEPVLHAAAVSVSKDAAVAIAGVSGKGKSTVAAMLCAAGAVLITDDTLRLELGEPVLAHPGTTRLRLRRATEQVAGWFPPGLRGQTADGRIAIELAAGVVEPLPLRAFLLPAPDRRSRHVVVEPVAAADAALALLGAARVAGWADPERLTSHLDHTAELARAVPTFRIFVPWGPPFERAVAAQLSRALEAILPP